MTVGLVRQSDLDVIVATDVDKALLAVLQEWLPTYLRLVGERRGLEYSLAEPRSYTNVLESDEWLDSQIPAVLVTTAKTSKVKGGPPVPYEAMWKVTISIVVRGRTPRETRDNAAIAEGCVRLVLTQKYGVNDNIIDDCKWESMELGTVLHDDRNGRYLAAGVAAYNVSTDVVAAALGGPDIPDATEYKPLAQVTEVTDELDLKTPQEPIE